MHKSAPKQAKSQQRHLPKRQPISKTCKPRSISTKTLHKPFKSSPTSTSTTTPLCSTPHLCTLRLPSLHKLSSPHLPSTFTTSPHNFSTASIGNSNGTPLIRTTLTDQKLYETESSKVFDALVHRIEEPDIDYAFPIELDFSGDVLNFQNPRGTWVLNKHNVTKQIWLSSPISGPSKYNYHPPHFNPQTDHEKIYAPGEGSGGQWLCERNNTTKLSDLLKREWGEVFKLDIQFQHDF